MMRGVRTAGRKGSGAERMLRQVGETARGVLDLWRSAVRRVKRWRGNSSGASEAVDDPRGLDMVLLCAVVCLLGVGMVAVYSASAVYAQAEHHSPSFFLRRNLVYGGAGLLALYAGYRIDYSLYRRVVYPMLLGVIALLGLLLVPGLGTRVDGATRWFHLAGVSFQPSEPAKFVLVAYLAYSLAKKQQSIRTFSIGFLPHLVFAGLICLLVLRQPDLGTAAVLGAVTLILLFVAGTKLSYLCISILAAAPVAYQLIVGTPWRLRRLLAFLDPWAFRKDAGYQISESLISIGSGGMYGLGIGDGKQKLFFLPAAHTDFILSIIGEELGFVGIVAVALLFLIIVWRGLRAAVGARDLFGAYLAYGITTTIGLQALLHMSVVLALVPTKGITLPLVSFGGSALITTLFSLGVLLNVAACNPEPSRFWIDAWRDVVANRRRPARLMVASGARGKEAASEP